MNTHEEGKGAKRAATYDTIKPGGKTASDIPPGRYEAVLMGAILQDPTESGQSLRLNFELCTDEFNDNSVPTWFKFYRGDGSINEFAIGLWKTTLARLGYQDVKESELPDLLEQITADRPGVIVKISYQNVKGTNYQRVEVEGPCDNATVAAYKESHEIETPY
jgi:hypothetical protein